ncbi:MAG TPA: BatA and WFA domain-containing protein, partial [Longimicrobiales bacterium]|nr:BatA and WFA domain-containing protein [Longimicrobiales bacterium]
MGFFNPLWLLLGGAIAVPIILHLLQRHQGPRVIFPAVRYLQRAEREHARRIRLRQLLLLLLRIAIVLALAFAAARPFLRGAGADHEPSAVVIVLDNSMSSGLVIGDRRVLDELKDRALETLNRASPDDRFWLLRAGAPWEPALPGNAATTAERVRVTEPSAASADIVASVARANGILAQGAEKRAKEIEVLSDLQTGNLRGALSMNKDEDTRVVLWAPARKEQANAAVQSVTLGGGLAPRAAERSTIVVGVGGTGVDSMAVRLNIDNRIVGAAITRAGSSVAIPFPPRPASLVSGNVEIDADALRADDKRFFIATIAPPPRVTLGRPVPFVSEALDVLASANRITKSASGADVVIAPGGSGADGVPPSSSVVVIAPETPLELTSLNRRLASLGINWQFQQKAARGALKFATASTSDELLRGLTGVRVAQSYQLTQTSRSADSVILRLEDNSPWAIRGTRVRGGRFVLIASPLNTTASNLPASPAMIPLIDRATGVWSAVDAPRSEVQ